MTRTGRRWVFAAIAVSVAALVPRVVSRILGRHRLRFTYAIGSAAPDEGAKLTVNPPWELVSLPVASGISLRGIVRRPLSPSAPWILFFPGNDATQLLTAQKLLERVRGDRDWGAAVWSYRGYDSSDGVPERDDLVADATRIFEGLLDREHIEASRVHVAAFSLGGYLAAHVVGLEAREGRKPASLSLLAAVQDIVMVRPSWAARLSAGDSYEILLLLDSVPAPVLVVQGKEDEALGVDQGRKIASNLGPRAEYVELAGVGHNALLETEDAILALRAMIERSSPP